MPSEQFGLLALLGEHAPDDPEDWLASSWAKTRVGRMGVAKLLGQAAAAANENAGSSGSRLGLVLVLGLGQRNRIESETGPEGSEKEHEAYGRVLEELRAVNVVWRLSEMGVFRVSHP